MNELLQKTCIFLLCLAPSVCVTYWSYAGLPATGSVSFSALGLSMGAVCLSFYCTQKWWTAWDKM